MGKPLPQSLIPCDIFVYGLVAWATFVGIHFSPLYKVQKVQGGADILQHMGQQRFYARAKDSVNASFSPTRSGTHQLLAAFTEQTLSHFGGPGERQIVERRQQARTLGLGLVNSDDTPETVQNKARRILLVLRDSLDDAPNRRNRQPWMYFNYRRLPLVPRVNDPQRFAPEYITGSATRNFMVELETPTNDLPDIETQSSDTPDIFSSLRHGMQESVKTLSVQCLRGLYSTCLAIKQDSGRAIFAYPKLITQVLQPKSHRYRLCQQSLSHAVKLIPGLRNLGPFDYLEHAPGEAHYDLAIIMDSLNPRLVPMSQMPLSSVDYTYAGARLRSHFKLCCWQDYEGRYMESEISLVKRLTAPVYEKDVSLLAWLCRGEIGQHEVQSLKDSPKLLSRVWNNIPRDGLSDPGGAHTFLLFFEVGLDIHEMVIDKELISEPK